LKEKTYKEQETEKRHGRKRYIERQAQDEEAQKEITDFLEGKEEKDKHEDSSPIRPFS